MPVKSLDYSANFNKASHGAFGHKYIAADEVSNPDEVFIQVVPLADTTIDYEDATPHSHNGTQIQSGRALPKGIPLNGYIKNVSVATGGGTVLCYFIQ